MSVILIDKVDDDFYHRVFFFCVTFGYHQSEGDKSIVRDTLGAIFIVENAVTVEKPQE